MLKKAKLIKKAAKDLRSKHQSHKKFFLNFQNILKIVQLFVLVELIV